VSPRVTVNNAASGGLPGGADINGKTVLWQYVADASDTTGVPLVNGAKAAAALTGLKLDIEYGNGDDATMVSQIQNAIAKREAGFASSVPDAALNKAICAAQATGAPVVTFNIDGTTGNAQKCVDSFVGQDFVSSGKLIADYMISKGLIKKGANVFCPVELPPDSYAVERKQGVDQALAPLGISCNELGTGTDLGQAKNAVVQYLLGHHDTNAIIALGGTPLAVIPQALKQTGMKVPVGGFDLSYPQIVSGIKDGTITASVNQELYAQGYYAIMEIALALKYGIPPQNINTSNNALLTKQNVGMFASLVPDYQ
jgi:ABC-type sugar transport system substrate-binding protein